MINIKMTSAISITDLAIKFKTQPHDVLSHFSMEVPINHWTALLGSSGSGKTTLLRYLAGLIDNEVTIQGKVKHAYTSPLHQNIAYMSQQDNLLPWLNILDNILLPFRFSNRNQLTKQRDVAKYLLQQIGLEHTIHWRPNQLSGGMRQRVALARTLIQEKPIVFMDEPFSSLDAVTRCRLQELAYQLLEKKSVLLITHDPLEAIKLATHLYVMRLSPYACSQITLPDTLPLRDLNDQTGALYKDIIQILGEKQ